MTPRSTRSLWLPTLAVVAMATSASSQVNVNGSIAGRVVDASDLPLPGVSVSAVSPALQGARVTYSTAQGDYLLSRLPAGDYTLRFELDGFRPHERQVAVAVATRVPLDVRLQVAGITHEMTVVAETSDAISITAPNATSFRRQLVEQLPVDRSLDETVALAPGVTRRGPAGQLSISGALAYESLYLINGVVITENLRRQPFELYIEDSIEETRVATGSIGAQFGRFNGGVVNAITRSGGNDFSGSLRVTLANDGWSATTPFEGDSRSDDVIPAWEFTLGGPIIADKLWFFGAGRLRGTTEARQTRFTNLPYELEEDEKRFEGKLTWSPRSDHTLSLAYTNVRWETTNYAFRNVMDERSLTDPRQLQDLLAFSWSGAFGPDFIVEAQYSQRHFTIANSGAQTTDRIEGTTIVDRQRGNASYWSPRFCAVCTSNPDESRDNHNVLVKAKKFISTSSWGSHELTFGFDSYLDLRQGNNNGTGSDYLVAGTTSILRDGEVFPVFDAGSTRIVWLPLLEESLGNRFWTHSAFIDDEWRLNRHWSFRLGLRYDRNDGTDASDNAVFKDDAWSPRLAASFDPRGDGTWTLSAGFGRYVSSIATSIGDREAAAGRPAQFVYAYLGPAINTDPSQPLLTTDRALSRLFDWFFANGGTDRNTVAPPVLPGVTTVIGDRLRSPSAVELSLGTGLQLGERGLLRIDGQYRDYRDFYAEERTLETGQATDRFGRVYDLAVVTNTDDVDRQYWGLNLQLAQRLQDRVDIGVAYTLSRAWGDFAGETTAAGPVMADQSSYPEYKDDRWFLSDGDLPNDQRHKLRLWVNWDLPLASRWGALSLGLLERVDSGTPYGAAGGVDTRPFVDNPGYVTPPGARTYWFLPRDEFRTETATQTDLNVNYALPVGGGVELFFRGTIVNLFNQSALTWSESINQTVLTADNASGLAEFDPFTETPVQGVHWDFGPSFGQPISRDAYQTPRTFFFSVGTRF